MIASREAWGGREEMVQLVRWPQRTDLRGKVLEVLHRNTDTHTHTGKLESVWL